MDSVTFYLWTILILFMCYLFVKLIYACFFSYRENILVPPWDYTIENRRIVNTKTMIIN